MFVTNILQLSWSYWHTAPIQFLQINAIPVFPDKLRIGCFTDYGNNVPILNACLFMYIKMISRIMRFKNVTN